MLTPVGFPPRSLPGHELGLEEAICSGGGVGTADVLLSCFAEEHLVFFSDGMYTCGGFGVRLLSPNKWVV